MLTVTKEFKKALKVNQSMVVRLYGRTAEMTLRPAERWTSKNPMLHTQTKIEWEQANNTETALFSMLYCDQDLFPVLHSMLKVGDQISLHARENNNGHITDANLHHDELCISVMRKDRLIIRNFPIAWELTPNDSCRAIKAA